MKIKLHGGLSIPITLSQNDSVIDFDRYNLFGGYDSDEETRVKTLTAPNSDNEDNEDNEFEHFDQEIQEMQNEFINEENEENNSLRQYQQEENAALQSLQSSQLSLTQPVYQAASYSNQPAHVDNSFLPRTATLQPPVNFQQPFVNEENSLPHEPENNQYMRMDLFESQESQQSQDSQETIEDISSLELTKLTKLDLLKIIFFQEGHETELERPFKNVILGNLQYRVDLNDISTSILGSEDFTSPISLSIRTRQMLCSSSTGQSLSLDIPITGVPEVIKRGKYTNGIIRRARRGIELIEGANENKFNEMMHAVYSYYEYMNQVREDMIYAYFGQGKDVDPSSSEPSILMENIKYFSSLISVEVQFDGNYVAIWRGQDAIEIGTFIGLYQGRIVSNCDIINREYVKSFNNILIDATNEAESNWTRYIKQGEPSNVQFDDMGFVFTTRTVFYGNVIILE